MKIKSMDLTSRPVYNYLAVALLFIMAVFSPRISLAIPNQHLNPHPDVPAKISWQLKPGVPDNINHVHIEGANIVSMPNVGFKDAKDAWVAEAAWDDRYLRFQDTGTSETNGLWEKFGHGYIDPTYQPRYMFADDVPNDAQTRVTEAMLLWNTRAKDEGEQKRTAPDGTPLKTSVIFEKVVSGAKELLVDFIEGFQEIRDAVAEWVVSAKQIVGGLVGQVTTKTLVVESTPTVEIGVDWDDGLKPSDPNKRYWKISNDSLALNDPNKSWSVWTDSYDMGWSYDKTPEILFDDEDIDYMSPTGDKYEGDETDFLSLGLNLQDSWGEKISTNSLVDIYEADFYSIALHEWGHVIGLLHSNDGIMYTYSPFTFNHTHQFIDNDNAYGAAALYSIPSPEPSTLLLLCFGLGGIFAFGRKKLFKKE
jgi:hypothetical protein